MPGKNPLIFSKEYYDVLKDIESGHWWVRGQRRIMARVLRGLARDGATDFLDVGCGSGVGLVWAKGHLRGGRVVGVDLSEHGLKHCEPLGVELHRASATDLPFGAAEFDLVLSTDLLQHVDDDRAVLAEAHRVLRPGGHLFLRTNARFLLPKHAGNLRLYTRPAVVALLREAGFEVRRASYSNVLGSLAAVVQQRLRPKPAHDHDGDHPDDGFSGLRLRAERGPLDGLKEALLAAEGPWIAALPIPLPFGHSLVCVARKLAG